MIEISILTKDIIYNVHSTAFVCISIIEGWRREWLHRHSSASGAISRPETHISVKVNIMNEQITLLFYHTII